MKINMEKRTRKGPIETCKIVTGIEAISAHKMLEMSRDSRIRRHSLYYSSSNIKQQTGTKKRITVHSIMNPRYELDEKIGLAQTS